MSVTFRPFGPADILALDMQDNQVGKLGMFEPVHNLEHGAELQAAGPAWTAIGDDGVILLCAGFVEVFGDKQATAWALLSKQYLRRRGSQAAILRFMRARVDVVPYVRIEALCRAGSRQEDAWLSAIGFKFRTILEKWGPLSEDYSLYQRIR